MQKEILQGGLEALVFKIGATDQIPDWFPEVESDVEVTALSFDYAHYRENPDGCRESLAKIRKRFMDDGALLGFQSMISTYRADNKKWFKSKDVDPKDLIGARLYTWQGKPPL